MRREVSYWLKILAVIPLLGMIAILVYFTVGDSAGGDNSGLFNAGPAMAAVGLAWLGWRYPSTGGWVSLALGGLAFVRYGLLTGQPLGTSVLIMALPPALSGVLFLAAAWFAGKETQDQPEPPPTNPNA